MPETLPTMLPSVRDRSLAIATFRHVCVRLMEMVAGWTPTTPQMEVKLLFGRQIWDFAQMADALGKRVHEMRQPLHFTRAPVQEYDDLLDTVLALDATTDRVDALGVLQSGFEKRLALYQSQIDPILDQPSAVILAAMVRELARQRQDAETLRQATDLASGSLTNSLAERESSIAFLVRDSALA